MEISVLRESRSQNALQEKNNVITDTNVRTNQSVDVAFVLKNNRTVKEYPGSLLTLRFLT